MHQVFKGPFTRRLTILLILLSLIPTLIIMVIPTIQRVNTEKENNEKLTADLVQKTDKLFVNLLDYKVEHFNQVIQPKADEVNLLAIHANEILSSPDLYASTAQWNKYENISGTTDHQSSPISDINAFFWTSQDNASIEAEEQNVQKMTSLLTDMRWLMQHDSTIQSTYLLTPQSAIVYPAGDYSPSNIQQFIDSRIKKTINVDQKSYSWIINDLETNPVLSVTAPIYFGQEKWGIAGVDILFDRLIEEIPIYGLTEKASMILISDNLDLLAIPSWGEDNPVLESLSNKPGEMIGENLSTFFPEDIQSVLEYPPISLSNNEPISHVIQSNFFGETAFFAFRRITDSPLNLMLILPLEDVFTHASYYGASLEDNTIPILTQALFSALGLFFVISIGSMVAVKRIANPIQELLKGSKEIARGNLDYRIPNLGQDEMQNLASSFNHMSEAIQVTQTDLQIKQLELANSLHAKQNEFKIINQITALANTPADLTKKIKSILDILNDSNEFIYSSIQLIKDTNLTINPVYKSNFNDDSTEHQKFIKLMVRGSYLHAVQEREIVYEKIANLFGETGEILIVGVPLLIRNTVIGGMILIFKGTDFPTPSKMAFLNTVSTHIALLIENADLQNQSRYSAIYEERRHIARELHDSVSQSVFSLSLTAESLKPLCRDQNDLNKMDFLISQADSTRKELRTLINELRPINLGNVSLEEAIEGHVLSLRKHSGIHVNLSLIGNLSLLSSSIQHNLNRIIQEALNNITHHSNATTVDLSLHMDSSSVILEVCDNGQGIDPVQLELKKDKCFGIISMRERAEIMGGKIHFESSPGNGVRISVIIPLEEQGEINGY